MYSTGLQLHLQVGYRPVSSDFYPTRRSGCSEYLLCTIRARHYYFARRASSTSGKQQYRHAESCSVRCAGPCHSNASPKWQHRLRKVLESGNDLQVSRIVTCSAPHLFSRMVHVLPSCLYFLRHRSLLTANDAHHGKTPSLFDALLKTC